MPESKNDLFWILAPSMFQAFSFLIMMVSVHIYASENKRIWSQIGSIKRQYCLIITIDLVFYLGFKISIHGETILLERNFGNDFETYKKSVNEILPFPGFIFNKNKINI